MTDTGPWVWIDDDVMPAAKARIGVLDHGFLYGDSVYETLRTHDGLLFRLPAHLDRLAASAAAIGLDLPWTRNRLASIVDAVVGAGSNDHDVGIRLVVTRGEGPLGIDPTHCPEPRLIVFGWRVAKGEHPLSEVGVDVIITSIRRTPPSALDPRIKSGNFLNNILAYREAQEAGAFEGVLLTIEGTVAEATTSNLFWVRGGEVRTSGDSGILLGVTRETVLEILSAKQFPSRRASFPPEDLLEADEAFLTSTLKGVLPIRSIDGNALAVPGLITEQIARAYRARVEKGE